MTAQALLNRGARGRMVRYKRPEAPADHPKLSLVVADGPLDAQTVDGILDQWRRRRRWQEAQGLSQHTIGDRQSAMLAALQGLRIHEIGKILSEHAVGKEIRQSMQRAGINQASSAADRKRTCPTSK